MESNRADIQQLRSRLDVLINKQNKLRADVDGLRGEIADIQTKIRALVETPTQRVVPSPPKPVEPRVEKIQPPKEVVAEKKAPKIAADKLPPIMKPAIESEATSRSIEKAKIQQTPPAVTQKPKEKSSIESFLGENLANKIGIAIILIGIGVGVKYAIDKNILGPAMRITIGYLAGAVLIGFALYLKKKYENLSAVMFAGGMAVAYFVTFIGFDFYQLFPKMVAFGIMLALTVVTSLAAIRYDKQIIAIVGLVGAYAVPFLLSDGTGATSSLFIYMTIINAGILFLAFKKNWQPVFSVAFGCTWLVFFAIGARAFISHPDDYRTLLLFGSIFYALFYAVLIANKMRYKEHLGGASMPVVVMNSVLGYAAGISLVIAIYDDSITNGIYTLLFAASQGIVTIITMKQKEADHRLYYLSFGLALVLLTTSIPMLFDGKWNTILWSSQGALFFWIARKKNDAFFEKIYFLPIILAFGSLFASWIKFDLSITSRAGLNQIPLLLNEYFFEGIILTGVLFFMTFIKYRSVKPSVLSKSNELYTTLSNSIIYLAIAALYFSIYREIDMYWDQKMNTQEYKLGFTGDYFSSLEKLKSAWIIIFTLLFAGTIQLINRYSLRDFTLARVFGIASMVAIAGFLISGLYDMGAVHDLRPDETDGSVALQQGLSFSIRGFGYAALIFVLWANWSSIRGLIKKNGLESSNPAFVIFANSFIYLGIFALYLSIFKENDIYWEQRENLLEFKTGYMGEFFTSTSKLKTIWMIIFSLIFSGAIQLVNRYSIKNITLSTILGTVSTIAVVAFLIIGLYDMSVLRDRAIDGVNGIKVAEYGLTFSIRYIGFAALGFTLWSNWYSLKYFYSDRLFKQALEIIFHICLVWVVCSELINLKKLNGGGDLYRAGLTIFGGIYSFGLIAFGIWKKKAHLRLLALVLFGVTLLKLFIYDISKVDSGGKTIAFISLGVLLLVISFLYTKYKHLILPGGEEEIKEKIESE